MRQRIYIKLHPRASQKNINKISDGEYEVWVTAPPIDGKANGMLIQLLSDYFDIPKSSLRIIADKTARTKIIEID